MPVLRLQWYERLHNNGHTFNSVGQFLNVTKQTAVSGCTVVLQHLHDGCMAVLQPSMKQSLLFLNSLPKILFPVFFPNFILLDLFIFLPSTLISERAQPSDLHIIHRGLRPQVVFMNLHVSNPRFIDRVCKPAYELTHFQPTLPASLAVAST